MLETAEEPTLEMEDTILEDELALDALEAALLEGLEVATAELCTVVGVAEVEELIVIDLDEEVLELEIFKIFRFKPEDEMADDVDEESVFEELATLDIVGETLELDVFRLELEDFADALEEKLDEGGVDDELDGLEELLKDDEVETPEDAL